MHRKIHKIVLILSDIEHILSPRFRNPHRAKLLQDYVRIRIKAFANRWFHFSSEHFLSYRVSVVDYDIFFVTFRQVFVRNTYFFESANESPRILDCGGNMGMTVLYAKYLYPAARITVFEPSREVVETLSRNIEQNRLTDVELVRAAAYESEGMVNLYPRGVGACGNTLDKAVWESTEQRHTNAPYTVPTVRLSTYVTEPIDLLKLDIEGGEGIVLNELAGAGVLGSIRTIAMEYHRYAGARKNDLACLLTLLETSGLEPELYFEDIEPAGVYSRSLSLRATRA